MSDFFVSLLGSFMGPKVLAALAGVLALILLDFVLGVLIAMKEGTFDVRKLPQFLESSFIPYAGGLLILALFSNVDPTLSVLFLTIAAAVYVKFLADIKDKVAQLFSEFNVQTQAQIDPKPIIDIPAPLTKDDVVSILKTEFAKEFIPTDLQNEAVKPVDIDNSVVAPVAVNTDVSTEPKPITQVISETLSQVGEQAKTQAVSDLTAKFTAVVQEATQPVEVTHLS